MDARRFDALTRALSTADSRRGLLGLLLTLPAVSALLAFFTADETAAKGRRKRRKKRHKHGKGNGRHRKGKRNKKRCKPKSRAKVCEGKCGIVKNKKTCKKKVDCGPCACDPACEVCFSCEEGSNTPGVCVPDPATVGEDCGAPGQVCQADGACACDVCAEGCPLDRIQAAIDVANPGDVIHICAGVYKEHLTVPIDLTLIGAGQGLDGTVLDGNRSGVVVSNAGATVALETLRVTGGNGQNAGGGILNNGNLTLTGCTVTDNEVHGGAQARGGGICNTSALTLIDSRVTLNKAMDGSGGGIYGNNLTSISLIDSSVSDNQAGSGGGIHSFSGNITLSGTSSVTGNSATDGEGAGGGIFHSVLGEVTLSATSRVCNNTPDQCVGFSAPPGVCTETCPG